MAPSNFKLTLTLINKNESPQDMDAHIGEAIGYAIYKGLKGRGGLVDPHRDHHRDPPHTGHKNGTIVWHLHGDPGTATVLAARWGGDPDPSDSKTYPKFTPTVNVYGPDPNP
jgi:hypothetical protein